MWIACKDKEPIKTGLDKNAKGEIIYRTEDGEELEVWDVPYGFDSLRAPPSQEK